ncbi:hypothetical protein [Sodalis ligni]|uniref:hypothetical protein n=1 Tax=Sodalis ligni TaxID=2697027 RepID=UPI0010437B5E|nr:hypothetical protein [Sodalis ligni]
MATEKIRYLRRTHDASPGDIRPVESRCASTLVLLGMAEYYREVIESAPATEVILPEMVDDRLVIHTRGRTRNQHKMENDRCGTHSGEKKKR